MVVVPWKPPTPRTIASVQRVITVLTVDKLTIPLALAAAGDYPGAIITSVALLLQALMAVWADHQTTHDKDQQPRHNPLTRRTIWRGPMKPPLSPRRQKKTRR